MSSLREQVKVEQTLSAIQGLQTEFHDWCIRRVDADHENRYQTQLDALCTLVTQVLASIQQDTENLLNQKQTTGELYDQCLHQERQLLWVQRVLWGYYREKFDQRDRSPALGRLLEAADDVVWSCYKEAITIAASIDATYEVQKPIPLTYIEPYYSAEALPRDEPPGAFRQHNLADISLSDILKSLPIPVISLPPSCIDAPWWLVFLAHEVGHHIQHDLGLVSSFGEQLRKIAFEDPTPKEDWHTAARWSEWGQEIFADTFSVYMVGNSAVWGLTELETQNEIDMMIRKDTYPSPAARLQLLATLANKLHLDGSFALRDTDPWSLAENSFESYDYQEIRDELKEDLRQVDKMALALTTMNVGRFGTFEELCGWYKEEFEEDGDTNEWKKLLTRPNYNQKDNALRSPRLIISAAIQAWVDIVTSDTIVDRQKALEKLAPKVVEAIEENRDLDTRSADPVANLDVSTIAADLSEQLRHARWSST